MKQELKQAIEEAANSTFPIKGMPEKIKVSTIGQIQSFHSAKQSGFIAGASYALSTPSILKHGDPKIFGEAGWVREEETPKPEIRDWECYEIHRPNIPANGCSTQCIDCKKKEIETTKQ